MRIGKTNPLASKYENKTIKQKSTKCRPQKNLQNLKSTTSSVAKFSIHKITLYLKTICRSIFSHLQECSCMHNCQEMIAPHKLYLFLCSQMI